MAMRGLFILMLVLAMGQTGHAQDLVFSTSNRTVWIHSNFTGETITLFGNIEPDLAGQAPVGHYDIVVVIRGPVGDRVVRRKARQFGIMLNADYALFDQLPSYYRVLSSRPLETILTREAIAEMGFTVEAQVSAALETTTGNVPMFESELIRLMEKASLFGTAERGVSFLSPTFFTARAALPSNVSSGLFLAQAFVVRDGEVVARNAQQFIVQKTGFERFLGDASRNQPLLYGLACVLLALVTGWFGGVLFRR